MKPENPFRETFKRAGYHGGSWVVVAQCTHGGVLAEPMLVRGASRDLLAIDRWEDPLPGGPEIWTTYKQGNAVHQAFLHSTRERDDVQLEPFVVVFEPPYRPGWHEPIHAFLSYCEAWPEHTGDGRIVWRYQDEDGALEDVAKWEPRTPGAASSEGALSVRRDRLMAFLALFEFDLIVYHQDLLINGELSDDLEDSGAAADYVYETRVCRLGPDEATASFFAIVLLQRPPLSATLQPWQPTPKTELEFPCGVDPATGQQKMRGFRSQADYLVPVFFKSEVLERYYADTERYEVHAANGSVTCKFRWYLPTARTKSGAIQAWLGDVAKLPAPVQRHWQSHSTWTDEGVPVARLRHDLFAEHVYEIDDSPVAKLKRAIEETSAAAVGRFGHRMHAELDSTHASRIAVLRVPANNSLPSFQEQLSILAILAVDHLNAGLFEAAQVPRGDGLLNRTASLYAGLAGCTEKEARESLGGLFAIQSLRSTISAHRAGAKATQAMNRAGIALNDLRAGFEKLVLGAVDSLQALRRALLASGSADSSS